MIWFLTGPFLYAAAAILVAGSAAKIIAFARLPRHLRWELYPLPRLGKAGSKYQKVDFANDAPHHERLPEIAFMAEEIFFLKKVFRGRRDLWFGSLLLHAGLYLGITFLGLLKLGAILDVLSGSGLPAVHFLDRLAALVGPCAMFAGLAGAVYLVCLRLADRGLRDMSDAVTFFNLAFLAALFGAGLMAWWMSDAVFVDARSHLASLVRGRPAAVESAWLAASMVLLGLFGAYLPWSRMFHFAAKYFFYHAILWDDEPLRAHSRMEQEIAEHLDARLTWSAKHLRQNRSWLDQLSAEKSEKEASHGP